MKTIVFDARGKVETSDETAAKFQKVEKLIVEAQVDDSFEVAVVFLFDKHTNLSYATERRIRKTQQTCDDISGFGNRKFKAFGHLVIALAVTEKLEKYQGVLSQTSFCLNDGFVELQRFSSEAHIQEYLICDHYSNNWNLVYPIKSKGTKWTHQTNIYDESSTGSKKIEFTAKFKKLSTVEKEKEHTCLTKPNAMLNWVRKLMHIFSKKE